jgi:hypothetical protein
MKITKNLLREMIAEEIQKELSEFNLLNLRKLFNRGAAKNLGAYQKVEQVAAIYDFLTSTKLEPPPVLPPTGESVLTIMKAAIKHRSEMPNYVIRGAKRGCLCKDDQGNSHRMLCKGKCPDCNNPKELAIALKSKCNPQR